MSIEINSSMSSVQPKTASAAERRDKAEGKAGNFDKPVVTAKTDRIENSEQAKKYLEQFRENAVKQPQAAGTTHKADESTLNVLA